MTLTVRPGAMGCGKSRHRSRDDSDADTKNNSNNTDSKKDSWSNGKRKKSTGNDSSKSSSNRGDGDKGGTTKSSPAKRGLTNGARSKLERSQEVGVPSNLAANRGEVGGVKDEPDNGTDLTSGKSFTLEVPNEITKQDSKSKVACKDFKSMAANKTVHITSSQIEFFKMLDEKIEKGDDYLISGDVSEVSSLDETYRQ